MSKKHLHTLLGAALVIGAILVVLSLPVGVVFAGVGHETLVPICVFWAPAGTVSLWIDALLGFSETESSFVAFVFFFLFGAAWIQFGAYVFLLCYATALGYGRRMLVAIGVFHYAFAAYLVSRADTGLSFTPSLSMSCLLFCTLLIYNVGPAVFVCWGRRFTIRDILFVAASLAVTCAVWKTTIYIVSRLDDFDTYTADELEAAESTDPPGLR